MLLVFPYQKNYNVLVKIQKNKFYVVYAKSIDTLDKAYSDLVTHHNKFVDYSYITSFTKYLLVYTV